MTSSQKISDLAVTLQETSVARDEARDSRMFSKEQWEKAILAHESALSAWQKAATPEAWLALRNEVLEECAKICDTNDHIIGADMIAEAIRALKHQRPA